MNNIDFAAKKNKEKVIAGIKNAEYPLSNSLCGHKRYDYLLTSNI